MNTRELSFLVMMSALGNALAFITIAPTMIRQIALDFSNLPVLIVATFAGPYMGFLAGLLSGILPSLFFGFIGGQLGVLGFTASIGKGIVGLTLGLLVRKFSYENRTRILIPLVLISFIPESLWIILVFSLMVPLFLPSQAFLAGFLVPILVKGWFEMGVMAFFLSALAGHNGFRNYMVNTLRIQLHKGS